MEIINPPQEPQEPQKRKSSATLFPILLIIGGFLLLGRNLDLFDSFIFNTLFSWQMLLIVIGVFLLLSKNISGGVVMIAVGTIFMVDRIGYWHYGIWHNFWPTIFIIFGVVLLLKRRSSNENRQQTNETASSLTGTEGYIESKNFFGDVKRTVNDPVISGGYIENGFASTQIDLRNSSLPLGTTILNVNCFFGSLNLYIPADWNVRNETQPVLANTTDKRLVKPHAIDTSRTLVIRGQVTFGSVEIRE